MEARVQKLEVSLKELQEEVRKMRASAPVIAGHRTAATTRLPSHGQDTAHPEPKEGEAEDLHGNWTKKDLEAAPVKSKVDDWEVQPDPKEEEAEDLDGNNRDLEAAPVNSKVDDWEVYEFQRSIWDTSMFVGVAPMGKLGSAMVCMLLIMTVTMQLMFCALINDHLTSAVISEAKVEELRTWRVSHAHDVRYMDTLSMKSMARQVCDKESVIWSEGTKTLLASIDEYNSWGGVDPSKLVLGPLLPTTHAVGPALCITALLVWYMTLLKDFESARGVARAMQLVPRGPSTRLTPASDCSGGTITLECLSNTRLCIALSTVLMRCVVHLVLLWSGSLYLVNTISLSDLLLNAVALEVVLTLEGLVFEAFVPHDSKKLIGNLSPLPKPRKASYKGVDVVSALGFTCAISLVIAMVFVFILPQVNRMKEARDAMCGGNVDFVAAFGNNGLLVVHPTPFEASPTLVASYEYKSVHEAIYAEAGLHPRDPAMHLNLSVYGLGVRGSRRSVEGMRDLGVASATSLSNSFCEDYQPHSNSMSSASKALLKSVFNFNGSVNFSSFCSHPDVESECSRDTPRGVRARQYCPRTCGCANFGSSLILTHPDEGCPSSCTVGLAYHDDLEERKNCTDLETTSDAWLEYAEGLEVLNTSWSGEWQSYLISTHSVVFGPNEWNNTCTGVVEYWKYHLNVDLCDWENAWRWKPLTFLCPAACGCLADPKQIGCPSACILS